MNLHLRIAIAASTALIAFSAAGAEEREGHHACHADVQKFCKGVQPGGGRIAACLKTHESELSPECKERIAEAREEMKEFHEACKQDVESLCKGVQPGQGRIMFCLSEQKDKLSAGCKQKFAEEQARHPCMKDVERLCKGVQPGQGRIAACMKQHQGEISAECKAQHEREHGHMRDKKE